MSLFVSGTLLLTAFCLFVYGIYRHEKRHEEIERKISDAQERYINR